MKIIIVLLSMALAGAFPAAAADRPAPGEAVGTSAPIGQGVAGHYLRGQFARNNGDADAAIRSLQRVQREEPENLAVALQLQGLLLMQGRVEEALALAEHVNALDAPDPLAILALTLRELERGELDAAAALLEKAEESGGAQLWGPLLSGWVKVARRQAEKPLTAEALNVESSRVIPLVNYHLALMNDQAGFVEEAAKNFKDAIEDPSNPPPRVMKALARFYERRGAPGLLTPLVESRREAAASDNGEPLRVDTVEDGVAEVLYTMGGIMAGAGAAGDAAIYLQLAAYIKPSMAEAVIALGDAYAELRQYGLANQAYARIPPESPLYQPGRLRAAVNHERMGRLPEALRLLDVMVRERPGDADAIVTKGDLLRVHGRYGEAIAAYSEGLKRLPEITANYWPVLFARGVCHERQGKWREAEKDMLRALALKPDQPDVLNYLGFGWLERGVNVARARAMIARAIQARPNDAQIIDSMGWALYVEGDYEQAAPYLEKAVEMLPVDPTVNDHLGDLYWRLGRKNEAHFQWRRALSFLPEARLAASIQKKLKEGLPPTHFARSAEGEVSATP